MGQVSGDVRIHRLEVRDAAQIAELGAALRDVTLDVMIHNAGVHDRDHRPEEVMAINARAPFEVVETLLPSLQKSANPRLVLVTSQLGARRGSRSPLGTYGESKAVLNDRFRELEGSWAELGIKAIVLHPGWVRTDMGGRSAPLTVEDSAAGIRRLIDDMGQEHHGGFWTWDQHRHPW